MEKKVHHQSIANKLNLARSTVTRVLNFDPTFRVSPETRNLIEATAKEMKYKPRRRRTGNIAVVVCGPLLTNKEALYLEVCEEAESRQYRAFLVNKREQAVYQELNQTVNPLCADGVIVTGDYNHHAVEKLAQTLPVVVVDIEEGVHDLDRVYPGAAEEMEKLVNMALKKNHRNIGVLVEFRYRSIWRVAMEGYYTALRAAGIEVNDSIIWDIEGRPYADTLRDVLNHNPRPSALIICTMEDHVAILSTLDALGCKVPQDMSYIAWSYMKSTSMGVYPTISSLSLKDELARAATNRLFERIEDRLLPPTEIRVIRQLNYGDTCVPPHND